MPELIDIGANLTNSSFRGEVEPVLDRARGVGVSRILVTGTSVDGSRQALDIARRHPETLFSTAGVHPHDAKSCDEHTVPALADLAAHDRVVALGECGLDYDRDFSPRAVQRKWFEAQVELAAELDLPLFLHERAAHDDFVAILKEHRSAIPRAVVHCFTGAGSELDAYLELDLYVGITGWICDERRGKHLLPLVGRIPPDRLMVETDAPFLLPRTIRPRPKSRRNEPAFLPYVVEAIAESTGKPTDIVARETTATATAFFDLPSREPEGSG